MIKKLLSLGVVILIFFNGCQKVSDNMLINSDWTDTNNGVLDYTSLSSSDYYSKDLVVIADNENIGGIANIDVGAALCIDTTSNTLLYADKVYNKLYPASLTKLMTALVVFEHAELTDKVIVSYNASHISETGAKLCGLKEGDVLTLEDLLYMLLIYSGNDAGIAIAEHVAGSEEEFCKLMNNEAKLLGAVDTNYVNSHGLHHEEQYTTAYDLYLIFHQLLTYDKFVDIISQTSYEVTYHDVHEKEIKKTYRTTNKYLLGDIDEPEGVTCMGGKTGTTSKAGYCLIAYCKDNDQNEYISLILKDSSSNALYSDMNELLELCQ